MTPDDICSNTTRKRPGFSEHQASVCHNWKEDESPTLSVINTVAAVTGTPPVSLRPLYETIDPDALDALFESASRPDRQSSQLSVSFRYEGCDVVVRWNGKLLVRLRDGQRDE